MASSLISCHLVARGVHSNPHHTGTRNSPPFAEVVMTDVVDDPAGSVVNLWPGASQAAFHKPLDFASTGPTQKWIFEGLWLVMPIVISRMFAVVEMLRQESPR